MRKKWGMGPQIVAPIPHFFHLRMLRFIFMSHSNSFFDIWKVKTTAFQTQLVLIGKQWRLPIASVEGYTQEAPIVIY